MYVFAGERAIGWFILNEGLFMNKRFFICSVVFCAAAVVCCEKEKNM